MRSLHLPTCFPLTNFKKLLELDETVVAKRMKKQICVLGSKEQVIHLLKECSGKCSGSEMKHILKAEKHLNMLAPYCYLQVLVSVIFFLKLNIYCFIKKKKRKNIMFYKKITNIGDNVEKLEP